ncbi:hypothetical protein L249_2446 [Ophiocordyceps polyrhachis-furcata BCC 54312]|uniref:Uncharacterized protein n=1 Tax=Ophiocordyceps polyrhachis-furcata BCC 54312 TaxID=1330021 RepID=A0A367LS70_9HYPO|nr:hypothetical protein L249_2446 [Ophiocordyceps polyrhachis-furcata BCC 54312]
MPRGAEIESTRERESGLGEITASCTCYISTEWACNACQAQALLISSCIRVRILMDEYQQIIILCIGTKVHVRLYRLRNRDPQRLCCRQQYARMD